MPKPLAGTHKRIADLLRTHGRMTVPRISSELGVDFMGIQSALRGMVNRGEARAYGGRPGQPLSYELRSV